MYKEALSSIDSIEIFPIISFVIFFCFFTFLLFMVWRSDKSLMTQLSALPLELSKPENGQSATITETEKTALNHA